MPPAMLDANPMSYDQRAIPLATPNPILGHKKYSNKNE